MKDEKKFDKVSDEAAPGSNSSEPVKMSVPPVNPIPEAKKQTLEDEAASVPPVSPIPETGGTANA